jgi:hypothetical protein
MHRVYNSAFMHMLRDEDNAGYRKVIRDTLEFDPEILQRYVNFMTNPDEETAIEQFGTGDKAFGVATLLATLPGLPMIGHGQIQAFTEKYGMEFQRARMDERPDEDHVARFDREIVPLLHDRARYAGASEFLLYDVTGPNGEIREDVFAYSNGRGPDRSLIVYLNRFASESGWIRESVAFARKAPDGSKGLVRQTLGEALELSEAGGTFVAFRDARSGLEYLRPAAELRERGLFVELDAYRTLVYGDFHEVMDAPDAPWSRLAAEVGSRGVASLDDALADLRLGPVHDALTALLADRPDGVGGDLAALRRRFLEAAGLPGDAPDIPGAVPGDVNPAVRAALLLEPIDRARFDELRLGAVLSRAGFGDRVIWRTRLALGLPTPSTASDPTALATAWLNDPDVRAFIRVHEWDGAEFFEQEAFEELLGLATGLDRARGARRRSPAIGKLRRAAAEAGYRVDAFRAALPAKRGGAVRKRRRPAAPVARKTPRSGSG